MKINAQQTSIEAYHNLTNLTGKRQEVYRAIRSLGNACNLDIAYHLKWAINRITPRVKELRELCVVEEYRRAITPRTGKRVIFWRVII